MINEQILSDLIKEGNKFNFENNIYFDYGEVYSRSRTDFLSWILQVENDISSNYDELIGMASSGFSLK